GAEQLHARDVERLAPHVLLAHVDGALQAEQRRRGRGGDAVLARPGLRDDPLLAELAGEQRLAEDVVDLVRAGVVEVLPLEDDPGPARVLGEPRHLGDDARAAGVGAVQLGELGLEGRVVAQLAPRGVELVEGGDQRLGDEAPPEPAEVRPLGVRQAHGRTARSDGCAPAATMSATACRGEPCVTRASPTRTTSAPARAYSRTS